MPRTPRSTVDGPLRVRDSSGRAGDRRTGRGVTGPESGRGSGRPATQGSDFAQLRAVARPRRRYGGQISGRTGGRRRQRKTTPSGNRAVAAPARPPRRRGSQTSGGRPEARDGHDVPAEGRPNTGAARSPERRRTTAATARGRATGHTRRRGRSTTAARRRPNVNAVRSARRRRGSAPTARGRASRRASVSAARSAKAMDTAIPPPNASTARPRIAGGALGWSGQ